VDPWRPRTKPGGKREAAPDDSRPALHIERPTHCRRCGRRLWAEDEADGLCVPCRWKARAAAAAGGSPYAVLTAQSRGRTAEVGWGTHSVPGKVVIAVLWLLTVLAAAGAMVMAMAVARAGGAGLQPATIAAILLLAGLATLNGAAAGSFTRFTVWAWWYVVVAFTVVAGLGILSFLSEGSPGALILCALGLTIVLAALWARLRKSE